MLQCITIKIPHLLVWSHFRSLSNWASLELCRAAGQVGLGCRVPYREERSRSAAVCLSNVHAATGLLAFPALPEHGNRQHGWRGYLFIHFPAALWFHETVATLGQAPVPRLILAMLRGVLPNPSDHGFTHICACRPSPLINAALFIAERVIHHFSLLLHWIHGLFWLGTHDTEFVCQCRYQMTYNNACWCG